MFDYENDKNTYLYIIICRFKEFKFMKVGKSKDLYRRINNVKSGCPHEFSEIFIMESQFEEEVIGWEKLIHRMLKRFKLNREWYLCDADFMNEFSKIIKLINTCEILGDDYDFLEEVSSEEVEILLHTHNIIFSKVKLPLGKSLKILKSDIKADEILAMILN